MRSTKVRIALYVSALTTLAVLGVALLECYAIHGFLPLGQLASLTLLVWLALIATLLITLGRVWPVALLMALLVPLSAVEAYLLVTYRAQLNGHTLTVMMATDRTEALQYLSGSAGWLFAVSVLTGVSLWAAWQLRSLRGLLTVERRAIAPAVVAGWLTIWALLWLWAPPQLSPNNGDVVSASARNFERTFPWGVPVRLLSFSRELARKREITARAAAFRFGARAPTDPRLVMLVIGESSRASSWQLGGYARKTNPELVRRNDVIWLQNYAANATATALSVPLMITRKPTAFGGDGAWPERSIVSAFGEAGYETWWISNQATAGMHDVLISTYAQEAANVRFINLANHESQGVYDFALVPEVEKALATGAARQFLVVHLMGSHHRYSERYPPEEAFFGTAETVGVWDNYFDAGNWGNAYDNSIRHTDRVLAALIAALERSGRPSVLLYAADHGELLQTASCDKRWHGHGAQEDVFASALVWLSPHEQHAAYGRAARRSAQAATSSKDMFDSLAMAGRLTFPSLEPANSWLSDRFVARPRTVSTFQGLLDADAPPTDSCGSLHRHL